MANDLISPTWVTSFSAKSARDSKGGAMVAFTVTDNSGAEHKFRMLPPDAEAFAVTLKAAAEGKLP
jgi:hypothetical protein